MLQRRCIPPVSFAKIYIYMNINLKFFLTGLRSAISSVYIAVRQNCPGMPHAGRNDDDACPGSTLHPARLSLARCREHHRFDEHQAYAP